jgi:hypothetical protein
VLQVDGKEVATSKTAAGGAEPSRCRVGAVNVRGGDEGLAGPGAVVATDRKLLWTLLILAGTVVGWALAVELEMDWVAMAGGAAALILLALIWFCRSGKTPAAAAPRMGSACVHAWRASVVWT